MELSEARERLFNIALNYAKQLSVEDIEALSYGADALKTIDDVVSHTTSAFQPHNFSFIDVSEKGANNDTQRQRSNH